MIRPKIAYAGHYCLVTYPSGTVQLEIAKEGMTEFKEILSRATNTWPDVSQHALELCDIVVHGESLTPRAAKV